MAGMRSDDDAFVESSAVRKLKFYHYFERPKMNLTEFSFSFYNILSIIVPVDCQWSPWTLGSCSKTCGVGTRTNTRAKLTVERNGGTCSGFATMTESCNNADCRTKFRLGIHYNIFPIMTYVMEFQAKALIDGHVLFDYFLFSGLAHLCYWLRILGKNLNPNIETIPLGACNKGKFFKIL